ncbi:MAG: hypothetical protein Q9162_004669 [Coniocarpon cinnabarinum]
MPRESAPTNERDACCNVVEFNLAVDKNENGGAELLVRAKGNWLFLSIKPEDLGPQKPKNTSESLRHRYEQLRDAAVKAQQRREAEVMGQVVDEAQGDEQQPATKKRKTSPSQDSGYSSSDGKGGQSNGKQQEQDPAQDEYADQTLQNWMLEAITPYFSKLPETPSVTTSDHPVSLAQWINAPLHFYALRAFKDSTNLAAHEHDDLDVKKFRAHNLQNSLNISKSLRSAAPFYSPDDILVLAESEDIHMPIHPTLVRLSPQDQRDKDTSLEPTHFLKLVPTGYGARHSVERELSILHKLSNLKSSDPKGTKNLRFPALEGLIAPPATPGSHASIFGFLLQLIPNPTPLTHKFDSSIPSSKRDRWGTDSKDMVKCLHDHGITWGDAKADNFLVDGTEKEELWMIDFGGGFTEGWVSSDLVETREGDREGIEKIAGAVRDPDSNTFDPEEGGEQGEEEEKDMDSRGDDGVKGNEKKRKR